MADKASFRQSVQLGYDLTRDFCEERDLALDAAHRTLLHELGGRLRSIRREDRLQVRPEGAPQEPSEEEKEKMRALGYGR